MVNAGNARIQPADGMDPPPHGVSAGVDTIVVIPCYNEARRLDVSAFGAFLQYAPFAALLFVDDGSTDDTAAVVDSFAYSQNRVSLVRLPANRGKAEAVRVGMLESIRRGATYTGYWDADLATPLSALPPFRAMLQNDMDTHVVMGARVQLLGRTIVRDWRRHYAGRVFATLASLLLGLAVYDTQCGAKLFRATVHLANVLAQPFMSRWIFDVELLARYNSWGRRQHTESAGHGIVELPLMEWRDVPGSKLRTRDMLRVAPELIRLFFAQRHWGR